jgi:hypothetical protein
MPLSQPNVYPLLDPQRAITQKEAFFYFTYAHTLLLPLILTGPPSVLPA